MKPWGEVKVGDRVIIKHGHHVAGTILQNCGSCNGKRMMFMLTESGDKRLIHYAAHRSVEVVE